MKSYNRVYASVNLDAIEHNFQQMRQNIAESTKMIAVVKADGYGHGAVQIAKLVESYEYLWGFATATVEEALILRHHEVTKPILILGYVFPENYEELVQQELRTAVFTYEMAKQLSEAAGKVDKAAYVHIKLDTGMGRIGFADTEESIERIAEIAKLPNLKIEGLFTHFAKADEIDKTSAQEQLRRYLNFAKKLSEAGVEVAIKHCSNSAGIIELKEANLDVVRAGISIYGIYPSDEVKQTEVKLQPVLEWKSRITHVKEVEAGTGISYGWTYVTQKTTRVATIPVGYADGYPRLLSNKGWVLIHGEKAPILGRVCMDQFMVDVTDIKDVRAGDEVTLVGKDGENQIYVEELSAICGRFPYEFVCDIGKRVPRVYKKNNQVVETKDYFQE